MFGLMQSLDFAYAVLTHARILETAASVACALLGAGLAAARRRVRAPRRWTLIPGALGVRGLRERQASEARLGRMRFALELVGLTAAGAAMATIVAGPGWEIRLAAMPFAFAGVSAVAVGARIDRIFAALGRFLARRAAAGPARAPVEPAVRAEEIRARLSRAAEYAAHALSARAGDAPLQLSVALVPIPAGLLGLPRPRSWADLVVETVNPRTLERRAVEDPEILEVCDRLVFGEDAPGARYARLIVDPPQGRFMVGARVEAVSAHARLRSLRMAQRIAAAA